MIDLIFAAGAAFIFAADRLTKIWILNNISLGESFAEIGRFFSFVYVRNEGAAFSMLSGKMGLLSIISVIFCIGAVIWWVIKKPQSKLLRCAAALMISGAAGNAVDRIMNGYVVDFIKTEFIDFPVFNIADIAITVGAVMLMIWVIFFDKKKEDK